MQTPAGFRVDDRGVLHVADWWQVIFNPSFPYRFAHMVAAAYLTTAFIVAGIGAWYILRERSVPHGRIMLGMALSLLVWLAPLQIVIGDLHGLNTLKYQPAKIAALEAHWETEQGRAADPVRAFPTRKPRRNHFELAVPALGSLILTHDWNGEIKGLKSFPPEDRPNPIIPFFAFRIMVGIGLLMIAVGFVGAVLWLTGRLYTTRWFLRALTWVSPLGFIAVLAGWFTAEVGRQPWTVYGVLRTADAVSPVARRQRARLAHPVRARLRHRVRRRRLLHCQARAARTRRDAAGPRRGRGGPFAPTNGSGGQSMTGTAAHMTEILPVLLPLVWAAILALAVFLYVLLGGYDLGLGVLFPLAPSHKDRDAMMSSVAPFWDGNETWLVLGGGGLLAAFPLAYSVMLPALYIPIILMLIGLILRGVAFEFRFKSERYRWTVGPRLHPRLDARRADAGRRSWAPSCMASR